VPDKHLKRPRDPVQLGKLIGDILTGQVEDRAAPSPLENGKDAAAVALGRKGGLKGGKARSLRLHRRRRWKSLLLRRRCLLLLRGGRLLRTGAEHRS
jgi:hypothetical protein